MSLVKDLVDLVEKVQKSIADRKTQELLLPIGQKVLDVQRAQFQIEQSHAEELAALKQSHMDEITALQKRIAEIEAVRPAPEAEFSEKTGTYIEKHGGTHYCPKCWNQSPSRFVPMQDKGYGWKCGVCDKYLADPDRPSPGPQAISKQSNWSDKFRPKRA